MGIALRDGMIASLTNPKGLLFLIAFLPSSLTLRLVP